MVNIKWEVLFWISTLAVNRQKSARIWQFWKWKWPKDSLGTICFKRYEQLWSYLERSGFQKKIGFFINIVFWSWAPCVFGIRPWLLILFPANRTQKIFWRDLYSLLIIIFKIVNFTHFFDDLRPIRLKFKKNTSLTMFTTPWACYIQKMTFLAFSQKKSYFK